MLDVTAATRLELIAQQLAVADRAMGLLAETMGMPFVSSCPSVGELRMIAAWLDEHPDVDVQLRTFLEQSEVTS